MTGTSRRRLGAEVNAYMPGDRVRQIVPGGETGSVIEQSGPVILTYWDDCTTSPYPVSLVVPDAPLLPISDAGPKETP